MPFRDIVEIWVQLDLIPKPSILHYDRGHPVDRSSVLLFPD